MGHENTANNNQAELDKTDIFDQLQHTFDALVSDTAPNVSPLQERVDKTALLSEHILLDDASSDQPTQTDATSISYNHPQTAKKEPALAVSTILLISLAVIMLISAIIASLWPYHDSDLQQDASDSQSTPAIIQNESRKATHLPVDKPASSSIDRSTNQAINHAASVAAKRKRQPPMQSSTSKNNNNQTLFTPARNGDWAVNLESFIVIDDANTYASKLEKRDIYTDIKTVNIKGKLWYRVRITGFSSKQDAEKQRQLLTKTLHLNSAWISKSSVTTQHSPSFAL